MMFQQTPTSHRNSWSSEVHALSLAQFRPSASVFSNLKHQKMKSLKETEFLLTKDSLGTRGGDDVVALLPVHVRPVLPHADKDVSAAAPALGQAPLGAAGAPD